MLTLKVGILDAHKQKRRAVSAGGYVLGDHDAGLRLSVDYAAGQASFLL